MLTGPLAAAFVNICFSVKFKKSLTTFKRFGSRTTCIVGSLISSVAIFASSYNTSFLSLLITLLGFGLGFVYIPAVIAVGEYFRE